MLAVVATTLGLTSFGFLTLSSNLAPNQDPTLDLTPPPYAPAQLELNVTATDVNGLPWQGQALLVCRSEESGFETQKSITLDPSGSALVMIEVDESSALVRAPYSFEIWGSASIQDESDRRDKFFYTAHEGSAAFPSPIVLLWDNVRALYTASFTTSLSDAPYYGSLDIVGTPPTSQLRLSMRDFVSSGINTWANSVLENDNSRPLPSGPSIDIYRWSRAPGSEFAVTGAAGDLLANGFLRRGARHDLAVPSARTLSVTVDPQSYPSAFEVLVIDPAHHSPDPNLPTKSTVDYIVQRQRAEYRLRCEFSSPTTLYVDDARLLSDRAYMIELWSQSIPSSGHPEQTLLDYISIPLSASDANATFD